jgi:hypothetical protein
MCEALSIWVPFKILKKVPKAAEGRSEKATDCSVRPLVCRSCQVRHQYYVKYFR